MNTHTKRARVRMISYTLTAIASLAILFGVSRYEASYYKMLQQYQYEHSLTELSEYMGNIRDSLTKGLYTGTAPMLSTVANKLSREATNAKNALSRLPLNDLNLENMYRFISQVGEYSLSLSKKVTAGAKLAPEEYQNLVKLSDTAASLSDQFSALIENLDVRSLVDAQLKRGTDPEGEAAEIPVISGFSKAEESLAELPSLIYDGPFSDSIDSREPQLTKGADEISRDEARRIASDFCRVPQDKLYDDSDIGGAVPCYRFSAGSVSVSVTKLGGYVYNMLNSRFCGEMTMSPDDALTLAANALTDRGIESMKQSYYAVDDGVCVVNFAYASDGVTYYTDLVKVGISMDNGEVVYFDAAGYIMNHRARTLPEKRFTAEQSRGAVSEYLSVMDESEALIPTDGENEVYCYEFHCRAGNGQEVLVYINVETCTEADVLLLMYTDNGILTI